MSRRVGRRSRASCRALLGCFALLLGGSCVAGCTAPAGDCSAARLRPAPAGARFAVVASDYVSTAVALLDAEGVVLEEAWVDSGSAPPGLAMALSGDVVLPTGTPPADRLVLLDRYGTDVLDVFELRAGRVLAQWPVGGGADAGGWRANPHDALLLSGTETRWVVSRFEPNLVPESSEVERGDDLVLLGPEGRVRARWPLTEAQTWGPGGERVWARPSRMVRVDDWIVVGLARLSTDFRIAAPGAVAVLESATGRLAALCEVPGLRNCPEVAVAQDGSWDVWVACRGEPFVSLEARRGTSGLARVRLDRDSGACERVEVVADGSSMSPAPSGGLVPLPDGSVLAVAEGELEAGEPDRLLWIGEDGGARVLWEADSAFVLGGGVLSADGRLALVPDAEQGVLRFDVVEGAAPRWRGAVAFSGCRGLPPRQIGRLRLEP